MKSLHFFELIPFQALADRAEKRDLGGSREKPLDFWVSQGWENIFSSWHKDGTWSVSGGEVSVANVTPVSGRILGPDQVLGHKRAPGKESRSLINKPWVPT